MKIRLHGTVADCRTAATSLATVLPVLTTSRPYPDRPPSPYVRIYLDTGPIPPSARSAFVVICPACPELDRTAPTSQAAVDLAGGHDDTHHHGTVTAVLRDQAGGPSVGGVAG
jgi:hypothetical protein